MFLRTSDFDAGFGVHTAAPPAAAPAEPALPVQGPAAPRWRRALRALGKLAGRAIGADRRRTPAWLDPDLMSAHMLRDLGIARPGALGRDILLRLRADGRY